MDLDHQQNGESEQRINEQTEQYRLSNVNNRKNMDWKN